MKEGRRPEYPDEKALVTSFRKCHILTPMRDSNLHNSINNNNNNNNNNDFISIALFHDLHAQLR